MRALCGSGTQLQTQALLHEKIQCLKQLGLKGRICAEQKTPLLCPAVSLLLSASVASLTSLSFSLSLLFFFFNLSPLLRLSGERAELAVGAGLCQAEGRLRGKRPGRSSQECAAKSARFTWLRHRRRRTAVTPSAVRGGSDEDPNPESLRATVVSLPLGEGGGGIHELKKLRERSCFYIRKTNKLLITDFIHFLDFVSLVCPK